jgi:hypothetical protein
VLRQRRGPRPDRLKLPSSGVQTSQASNTAATRVDVAPVTKTCARQPRQQQASVLAHVQTCMAAERSAQAHAAHNGRLPSVDDQQIDLMFNLMDSLLCVTAHPIGRRVAGRLSVSKYGCCGLLPPPLRARMHMPAPAEGLMLFDAGCIGMPDPPFHAILRCLVPWLYPKQRSRAKGSRIASFMQSVHQ